MSVEGVNKANSLFVDNLFELALVEYNAAISANRQDADAFAKRAHCHIKLNNYKKAVKDAEEAIALNSKLYIGHYWYAMSSYKLGRFEEALKAFQTVKEINPAALKDVELWIGKCMLDIKQKSQYPKGKATAGDLPTTQPTPPVYIKQADVSEAPISKIEPTPAPTFKYDWYQTTSDVIVTVLLKNISQEQVKAEFSTRSFSVEVSKVLVVTEEGNKEKSISLFKELFDRIVPEECRFTVFKTKIEFYLRKKDEIRWTALDYCVDEETDPSKKVRQAICTPVTNPIHDDQNKSTGAHTNYPSSAKNKKDWDSIYKSVIEEEKGQKHEGDAAVNNLFQTLYADADEDTRRAMNKSFQESNGTVLSTNWSEISKKKTKIKAPDGLVVNKYEI